MFLYNYFPTFVIVVIVVIVVKTEHNNLQISTPVGQGGEIATTPKGWREAIEVFLTDGELDVKPLTKKQYRKALTLFFEWCDAHGIPFSQIAKKNIIDYREELLTRQRMNVAPASQLEAYKPLSALTVASYIVAIRRFYAWAESMELYPNIARGVKSPRVKDEFVKEALTADECRDILDKLFDDITGKIRKKTFANGENTGLRNYALVNLLLRTGLRTIEASRLNIMDISERRRMRVLLVWGKGRDSKDDYIPLSDKAYEPLMQYIATRPGARPEDPLFICEGYGSRGQRMSTRRIQAVCKEALREIGLDSHAFSAHSFRHTCASILIESGASAYDTQKFLRHASIDTTERYLKSREDKLRLERGTETILDNVF